MSCFGFDQLRKVRMAIRIIVLAKQVIDPEMPPASFKVDRQNRRVVTPESISPVVNGFDENAVEAALRIKDSQDAVVTVLSMGRSFVDKVMKKPLAMGADNLVLLQDEAFPNTPDSSVVAKILTAGIKKLDGFDLVIAGRQASDWDNAQVPLAVAELLDLPCITIGTKVEVSNGAVTVERITPDGSEVVEASLPAMVTVTNELGQPRYPNLRAIMAADRKKATLWSANDLDINVSELQQQLEVVDLFVPVTEKECVFIRGEDEADSGRLLALKLREDKLI